MDIVQLLLEHKADPNLKNEFDRIPFEESLQNGFAEVAVNLAFWINCNQEVLAKVSKLDDEKVYTSLQEVPEENEENKGDDMFDEGEQENQLEDDQRSYQSEEAIRQEEAKQLTEQEITLIQQRQVQRDQQELEELNKQMKEKFNMQEFDIEIKKIDNPFLNNQ